MNFEIRYLRRLFARLLVIILLSPGLASAAGISKWVDQNGKTHYGSRPPSGVNTTQVKKPAAAASNPQQQQSPEIILYSTAWCGYCKKARAYLQRNNVQFTEKDIEKSAIANREHKALGGRGVPLLVRGGKETRAGFSENGYDSFFGRR